MLSASTFESEYARAYLTETVEYRNVRILESESFIAVPSVGAIVPGWVLIVPKIRALALGGLSKVLCRELARFEEEVRRLVAAEFGDVVIFEHGPSKPSCKVGCGVDYAHLHIVPFGDDLRAEAERAYPHLKWEELADFQAASSYHRAGKSYLYFRQPSVAEKHFIVTSVEELPSQLFRRLIARRIGVPEQWDWKQFPHVENMEATCNRLAVNPILCA